jgi:glycosyltransferase involved in cell wall biosynthesis
MKFSVVVAFKNRDQKRVQFFLDSLQWQTENDFQLIFVNQGSEAQVNEWLEPLLSNYSFVQYIHNFTQGHLFNKSNALNIGIHAAKGKYIVIADIDILFPVSFLKRTGEQLAVGLFLTFNAYYLPSGLELITAETVFLTDYSQICTEKFIGLCVATKDALLSINGYDEYYLGWGAEDDDVIKQLILAGEKRMHFSAASIGIYHQWHIGNAPLYPSPWYLEIVNYLYLENRKGITNVGKFGIPVNATDRSVLQKLQGPFSFNKLELLADPLLQFTFFLDGFYKMNSGEYGQFEFPIPPVLAIGRKQTLVSKLNRLLSKWNFPYILTKRNVVAPINTRESWYDFVTYFIGKNRSFLQDYYLMDTDEKLVFYFQKK